MTVQSATRKAVWRTVLSLMSPVLNSCFVWGVLLPWVADHDW
jgi:hypothetical protein